MLVERQGEIYQDHGFGIEFDRSEIGREDGKRF